MESPNCGLEGVGTFNKNSVDKFYKKFITISNKPFLIIQVKFNKFYEKFKKILKNFTS